MPAASLYARGMSDETATGEAELHPGKAADLLASGEAQLIDVRQHFEWEAGRVPGAVHIPLETLPTRADEIERDRVVIFICRTGARSAMATQAFRASGIEAFNLVGGIEEWIAQGREIEPPDGRVASPRPDNS